VVLGAGHPGLVTPDMLNDGTLVIDFGYGTKSDGKTGGDFDPGEEIEYRDIIYTPTPGGTGPILVAKLFENIVRLNKNIR